MREYAKVGPTFWSGRTGRALKKKGPEAVIVGLYLMTCQHANMLGLYYLDLAYVAVDTGLGFEGASKGLRSASEVGFCRYDEESGMVWVIEMAKYQIADQLEAKDNRCRGIQREYDALPENPYLSEFYDRYAKAFHMTNRREFAPNSGTPSEGASKPLPSQEQEQEQEQEKEQEKKHMSGKPDGAGVPADQPTLLLVPTDPPAQPAEDPVEVIFDFWRKVMNSPRSVLDDKRRKAIKAALGWGYEPAQICRAIRGCSKTAHNMGQNDRGQKYNGIELILRSADQIDRFIGNDAAPPRAAPAAGANAQRDAINAEAKRLLFGGGRPPAEEIIDV